MFHCQNTRLRQSFWSLYSVWWKIYYNLVPLVPKLYPAAPEPEVPATLVVSRSALTVATVSCCSLCGHLCGCAYMEDVTSHDCTLAGRECRKCSCACRTECKLEGVQWVLREVIHSPCHTNSGAGTPATLHR